ncbi:MAG TPA: DUF2203 domain-containing protein [Gaiellaceae bacterium]|nr:DUF2203 domain-containing protein [Gaiellaceae bacterium]
MSVGTMAKMRLFTQEEANALLPKVRALVERLVEERRALVALGEELEAMQALIGGNGGSLDPSRIGELQEAVAQGAAGLTALVDELNELGVQMKDLDRGLVDFPARHPERGDTVLLCWELGEAEVAYWHDTDAGFAGRKPLPF